MFLGWVELMGEWVTKSGIHKERVTKMASANGKKGVMRVGVWDFIYLFFIFLYV